MQDFRAPYERAGLSERSVDIITASWRLGTQKQYIVYVKQWNKFCLTRGLNRFQTHVNSVVEFLSELFYVGKLSNSAINTARSALSSFVMLTDRSYSISSHPFISRFMKGVFNLRPPMPRYKQIWDVGIILRYLRKLSPARSLSLKALTLKVCMLIALVSAQRVQTIQILNIVDMTINPNSIVFHVRQLLKQSRPGNTGFVLTLNAYPPEKKLCIYNYLTHYLIRTKNIRGAEKSLFISFQRPYNSVSKDTIARWIRTVMSLAGLNTDTYSAHSTRAAAASKASTSKVSVDDIMRTVGWSSEKTFSKFYNKPITAESGFAKAVLKN